MSHAGTQSRYRLVDTEVHFAAPEQMEAMSRIGTGLYTNPDLRMNLHFIGKPGQPSVMLQMLYEVDEKRLQAMDAAGVAVQVLSLAAPGVQMFDADTATGVAAAVNDRLAEIIQHHPARFGGLATFAPQDPPRAAKEIERAIHKLKLNGLLVNSHTNGEYLDDRKFWPILEAAEACQAPIYIHPRHSPDWASRLFAGDFGGVASFFAGPMYGYAVDVGLHALRLMFSGVFDQFPKLKIVLGHMGEGIPYWFYRLDYYSEYNPAGGKVKLTKKKPSQYFKDNFLLTTSGMFSHPVLKYVHEAVGPDNIMYASDWPYQPVLSESTEFVNTAPLPAVDMEKFAHGNAERVFRLDTGKPAAAK